MQSTDKQQCSESEMFQVKLLYLQGANFNTTIVYVLALSHGACVCIVRYIHNNADKTT